MYDKLILISRDFEIDNTSKIRTQEPDKGNDDNEIGFPLYKNRDTGGWVYGKKSYFKKEKQDEMRILVDINQYGMRIVTNPSKIINDGMNYDTADNTGIDFSLDYIQKTLIENGIHTNIDDFKVSRMDTAQTSKVKYRFSEYPFQLLRAKRMVYKNYGTTHLFHNGQREVCFYDKMEQIKIEHNIKDPWSYFGIEKGTNIMRAELRAKTQDAVKGTYGSFKPRELGTREVYEEIKRKHYKNIGNIVFSSNDIEEPGLFVYNQEVDLLIKYKVLFPRGAVDKYLADRGLIPTLNKLGGLERFKNILIDAGFSPQHANGVLRELQKRMDFISGTINEESEDEYNTKLYRELKETFYRVA